MIELQEYIDLKLDKGLKPEKLKLTVKIVKRFKNNYMFNDKISSKRILIKPDKNSTYKISATHQWIIMRFLPVLIGEKLKADKAFLHFVQLVEIVRSLNDDEYDDRKINDLTLKIEKYLQEFKIIYPNEHFTPKQHFLIHYPSAIRLYGPPKFYSTMRFESKHSYFKHVIQATHNRINLLKSLAERHQRLQVFHLTSPNYFMDIDLHSIWPLNFYNLNPHFQIAIPKYPL